MIIDADDSGDCSEGDLVVEDMWFGWMEDVVGLHGSDIRFSEIGTRTTWGDSWICDYYVPTSLLP